MKQSKNRAGGGKGKRKGSREWSDGRIATPVASQSSAAWPPALGLLVHLHERQVQQGTEPASEHYTHTRKGGDITV